MKPSLEALLTASLSELKTLNQPVELEGPSESLDLIDAATIQADAIAHVQDERYNSTESLQDAVQESLIENAQEHAQMRHDINEVRTLVQNAVSSMEMLHQIVSTESFDDVTLATAQAAMSTLGTTVGDVPPVLEAEHGQLTQASMEGLVDFVKKSLTALKKWIKEKYDAMVLHFRRSSRDRVVMDKRIAKLQEILGSIPEEHGVPSQAVTYAREYAHLVFFNGKPLTLEKGEVQTSIGRVLTLIKDANSKIAPDAVKRSNVIADTLANVLVANEQVTAEQALKKLYQDIVHPMPSSGLVTPGEELTGMTFYAPDLRTRYRDVEWIMELVRVLDTIQVPVKYRASGVASAKVLELDQLKALFDLTVELYNDPAMSDMSYYNELGAAWAVASRAYNRLVTMAQSMDFPQMNNELWRGLDIALSAMFSFLDKGYYHVVTLRNPAFRLVHGLLYIMEEQAKAYRAVNRVSMASLNPSETPAGASEEAIADVEKQLGMKFGKQYRAFLNEHGALVDGHHEVYGVVGNNKSVPSTLPVTLRERKLNPKLPKAVAVIYERGNGVMYTVDGSDRVSIVDMGGSYSTGKDFNTFLKDLLSSK